MNKNHPKQNVLLNKVGRNIRNARKLKNMSQESLSLECGLDRSYVGGVERGERNISIVNLKKIADALKLRVADLLSDL